MQNQKQNLDDLCVEINHLYQNFKKSDAPAAEKYMVPFPMGVFGTLRIIPEDQGNARLMTAVKPAFHCRAFLPHFYAKGISLYFNKDSTAPLELFYYNLEEWRTMIQPVDRLEGVSPGRKEVWGYARTLMMVKILPDKYADEIYQEGLNMNTRDLGIPPSEWGNFSTTPAWVYSNPAANKAAAAMPYPQEFYPILWDGNPD